MFNSRTFFSRKFQLILERIALIGQPQTRTAYGGHGYFVQAKRFQRRRFV
jgi:hypothetical protein